MAVYLELIAEDLDDIGEWLGALVASSNAQVELLPDGDMYVSIDFRRATTLAVRWDGAVDDETVEGHPRPLVEVLADLPEPDGDELLPD
jgi:hypothetical protein